MEVRRTGNLHSTPSTQVGNQPGPPCERHASSRAALQAAYKELQASGTQKLWYLDGEKLLGADRDDTTDGSHPSDLGFYRQADAMEPVLREALGMA